MKITILCLYILMVHSKASPWDNITANIAVIEFERTINDSLTPRELMLKHFLRFQDLFFVEPLYTKQFDMVIFPELSLGISPEIATEVNLNDRHCDFFDTSSSQVYMWLASCMALYHETYLVINVVEKAPCSSDPNTKNCQNGSLFYNTDVVFNREGFIYTKYRKYNLFGEKNLNRPDRPEVTSFGTDFGVKFGIFTCFDILFKNPPQELMREHDIDAVIYPTNWHSELPFLTALQTQQMWSYTYDTMLFAAGGNQIAAATGGTGIHKSGRTIYSTYVASGGTQVVLYESIKGEVTPFETKSVDDLAKEMDAFSLWTDDSLNDYAYQELDTSNNEIDQQLCYKSTETNTLLCCNFTIKLTNTPATGNFNFYTYFLTIYAGIRRYPDINNGGLEVCGIIACLNSSFSSCGRRFPKYEDVEWPVTFEEMEIKAAFDVSDDKVQFPNSLLSSIRPIDGSETEWTSRNFKTSTGQMVEKTFKITKPQNRVLTFAIYGRNFAYDSLPEDDDTDDDDQGGAATSTKVALFLVLVSSLILMIV